MQNHAFVLHALARRPGGPLGTGEKDRNARPLDFACSLRLALDQLAKGKAQRAARADLTVATLCNKVRTRPCPTDLHDRHNLTVITALLA